MNSKTGNPIIQTTTHDMYILNEGHLHQMITVHYSPKVKIKACQR